jgi:NitT/TauT family transport system permease protein
MTAASLDPSQNRSGRLTAVALFAGQPAIMLLVLVAWYFASGTLVKSFMLSDPVSVAQVIWRWVSDGSLWLHLAITFQTLLLGYCIGALAGISGGLLLGIFPKLDVVVAPFIVAIYALPKIALLPLFVILLGIGLASKVAIVAVVVFFILLFSTRDGVRDVDPDLVGSLRLRGARQWEINLKVLLPATLPWIYTGLRVSTGYALTTTVVAEVLSSNRGLGFLIESSAVRFDSAGVFAAIVVLGILSFFVTGVLGRFEAASSKWRA